MKTLKNIFNKDFFRKICGKVSNFTVRRTIGFKPVDVIDIDETTYLFGFKIKHIEVKNININDEFLINTIKNTDNSEKKNLDRIVVKGFVLNKKRGH
jgi:hypothetical protein